MGTVNFATRWQQDELMDTESVSFEDFRACLVDLARVNTLTFARHPTLDFLTGLLPRIRSLGRPLEVVDVGSGYGDLLRDINTWAVKHGVPVSLTGVDLNPWSHRAASEATPTHCPIQWVRSNVFDYEPHAGIDVVVSSLFTHHLDNGEIVRFLGWMEKTARLGWSISDLHRHPVPYYFFRSFSKLARFHRFVQHDGPVSIGRAFTLSDWKALLNEAGIDSANVDLRWRIPFKITLGRVHES